MQMKNTFEMARYGAELKLRLHDMPVGDPMSGAAYGEQLKSKGVGMLIGIVASVVTMGAAAPLLAVGASLASQIAGGVMMAGGVLSGVGAVTGNKKLAKIGGVLSLAGGIGSLAIGATGGASGTLGQSLGKGSDAVASMSSSFMDSASGMSGGLLYGDRAAGAAGAGAAKSGTEAGNLPLSENINPAAGEQTLAGTTTTGDPSAVKAPVAGELKLAGTDAAVDQSTKLGAAGPTGVPLEGTAAQPVTAPAAPGDGLKFSANDPNASAISEAMKGGVPSPETSPTTPPGKEDKLWMGMDKTELFKTGTGFLEKAAGGYLNKDAEAAKTDQAQAQTDYYNANTEIKKAELGNMAGQVVVLSEDDVDLQAKIAAAEAAGKKVSIIPGIGKGGVKAVNTPLMQAQQISAQTPVRQGVFNRATA